MKLSRDQMKFIAMIRSMGSMITEKWGLKQKYSSSVLYIIGFRRIKYA